MSAPAPRERIVLLGADAPGIRMAFHALAPRFPDLAVVLEDPVGKGPYRRRRIRRYGWVHVAGQMLFSRLALPMLVRSGRRRVEALKRRHALDDSPIRGEVHRVRSANSEDARRALRELDPRVVVVVGARVIGRETLGAIDAPFINIHGGITPRYRGVYGGYWALVDGRPDLAGTTIHFVDAGIDTGAIIRQVAFTVTAEDSVATHPYLYAAAGLSVLPEVLRGILDGDLTTNRLEADPPSIYRSYPTLWGYLRARIARGVR